jgi:hypothetical protein
MTLNTNKGSVTFNDKNTIAKTVPITNPVHLAQRKLV